MDGRGLLENIKVLRQRIALLVKAARACNKYSVDLHSSIDEMDRVSKEFYEYVDSAYQRASARASYVFFFAVCVAGGQAFSFFILLFVRSCFFGSGVVRPSSHASNKSASAARECRRIVAWR